MIKKYIKKRLTLLFLTSVVLNVFLLNLEFVSFNNQLVFAMLDVGQGDALFIESPTGTQILIDSGSKGKAIGELTKVMSPFDRNIDALIATHPDTDHIGGFSEIISEYSTEGFLEPDIATDSKVFKRLKKDLEDKNIPSFVLRKNMRLNLGGGAVLDVIFPDRSVYDWETNAGSLVMKLSYKESSFLLTGDAPIETEKIILETNDARFLKSNFLKIGHHGSSSSTSEEFLKNVSPMIALVSVGSTNSYGHPTEKVLNILKENAVQVLRTDLLGTVIIKSDGKKESFFFSK